MFSLQLMENILVKIRPNLEKILLFAVFVFLLTAAITLNKPSLFYIMAIFFAVFFFFKDFLWLAPVLSLPAITMGEILKFELAPYYFYEFTIAEALLLMAAAVYLLDKFVSKKTNEIKFDAISFFLFLYLSLALLSFFEIISLKYYLFGLKAAAFSFLAYFLALNLINSRVRLQIFLFSATAALLVFALEVFYKFYTLGFSDKFFFERKLIILPPGPLATVAAIIAMMLAPVLVFFLAEKNFKSKAIILPAFCFGFFALFISLGKAAILAFLCGMVYLFFRLSGRRKYFLIVIAAAIVLATVFLSPLAGGLITRVKTTFVDSNTRFRVLEYQTAWRLLPDHLLFGVGAGQQLYYFKKLLNYDTSELVNNFFLQAVIDYGLLGLFTISMLLASLWRKARAVARAARPENLVLASGFMAMLIVALINGLLEVTFFALPYAIIFWLMVGAFVNSKYYYHD